MLVATMALPKIKTPVAKVSFAEGRKKSLLSRHGDEAKHAAERALLLKTLKSNAWNLTHTARALEMPGPSQVLRSIKDLGLSDEYEKAKGDRE